MQMDHYGFQVRDVDSPIKCYTEKMLVNLDYKAVNEQEKEAYAFLSLGKARLELIQDLVNEHAPPAIKKHYCPHFCTKIDNM